MRFQLYKDNQKTNTSNSITEISKMTSYETDASGYQRMFSLYCSIGWTYQYIFLFSLINDVVMIENL